MASEYKKKVGLNGTLLLEPKPQVGRALVLFPACRTPALPAQPAALTVLLRAGVLWVQQLL